MAITFQERGWLASLSLTFLVSSVYGQTFTPIFSKQYARLAGAPITETDSFTACDPSGTFRIVVLNGPGVEPGIDPISSGSVFVNGIEVVRERDFDRTVRRIERPLTNVLTDNRVEVRVRSGPQAAIRVVVEAIQACGVRITTPAPGSVLTGPLASVRGEVPLTSGEQVGVTVNGVQALIESGRFATVIPIDPSVTSLTVRAVDFSGTVSTHSIPVVVQAPTAESPLRLLPTPPGGVAPLSVGFGVSTTVSISQVALDLEGDGVIDFQGATLQGQLFTYSRPGIYTPTVRVTDGDGRVHTAFTLVQVLDRASLDVRLRALWERLKDSLRVGDVTGAMSFIHSESRAAYQERLTRFSATTLANIDQYMTSIELVEVGFGGAQYEMVRLQDGQTLSFSVWFQIDQDGLWRLKRF